jgi:hypothetical protein
MTFWSRSYKVEMSSYVALRVVANTVSSAMTTIGLDVVDRDEDNESDEEVVWVEAVPEGVCVSVCVFVRECCAKTSFG